MRNPCNTTLPQNRLCFASHRHCARNRTPAFLFNLLRERFSAPSSCRAGTGNCISQRKRIPSPEAAVRERERKTSPRSVCPDRFEQQFTYVISPFAQAETLTSREPCSMRRFV
jgi:hypothetical protein